MNIAYVLQHLGDVAPDSAYVVAEVRVGGAVSGHVVRVLHYPCRESNAYVAELDGRELRGWSSLPHAIENGIRAAVGSTQGVAAS